MPACYCHCYCRMLSPLPPPDPHTSSLQAVLFPLQPLYDRIEKRLKPNAVRALKRVFVMCDSDQVCTLLGGLLLPEPLLLQLLLPPIPCCCCYCCSPCCSL